MLLAIASELQKWSELVLNLRTVENFVHVPAAKIRSLNHHIRVQGTTVEIKKFNYTEKLPSIPVRKVIRADYDLVSQDVS